MKRLKLLFATGTIILFSNISTAKMSQNDLINTQLVDDAETWVVKPGTRLAAGNSGQNEFYILEKSEAPAKMKIANKNDVAKIKVALNKTLHHAAIRKKSRIKVATKNKNQKRHISG